MTTDREGFEIVSKAKFAELLEGEVRPQDALLWPLQTRITQQALAMDRSHAPRCRVGQIYAVGVRCWAGSTAGNPTSALTLPPEFLRSRLSGLPSLSPRYFQSGHVPLRDPSAETQP
jgi:hypothetical protein